MTTPTLSLEVIPLHRTLALGAHLREHLLLRIKAHAEPDAEVPRLTVLLALDVSGSMEGEPIAQVIRSGCRLTEILNENDTLGVVSFADAARTVVSPIKLTPEGRKSARRAIESLVARGGTNMSGALAHAALLMPERGDAERQTIIVMSDGQPNVGAQTAPDLASESARIRARGTSVSTLGFGNAHNPQVLQAISDAGAGRYAFVADPTMASTAFAQAIGTERDVVAEQVTLTLSPSGGAEIVKVLGDARVTFSAEGLRIALADLIAGDELNIVVEVRVAVPKAQGPWWPIEAVLRARRATNGAEIVVREGVEVTVSELGSSASEPAALAALLVSRTDDARQKARAFGAQRRFQEARQVIRAMMTELEESEGFSRSVDGPVSDAYEALVDDLAVMEKAPDAATYEKYQRASLDVMDLAQSGNKRKANSLIAHQSRSSQAMSDRLEGIAPKAYLEVIEGANLGTVFSIEGSVDIGRSQDVSVRVMDASVSRRHARVLFQGGAYWAVDLGSSFGMVVNGQRVDRMALQPGDVITLGSTRLRYLANPPKMP